ncbi:hypothetical protein SBADM41S_02229 [Streptomyces badius]
MMRIWVNGGLRDTDDARLSVLDHGLTVGDGVFETVRTSEGRPFALTRHLDRLTRSARGLGLSDPDHDEVRHAVAAVIDANPVALGRLRIDVRPALALLDGLLGGLGRGERVLVLLQREVPQPHLDAVPVPGAQGADVIEGSVAVGAFEVAPEVEDDRCRRGGIAHMPSLPGRADATQSAPGPTPWGGARP